MLRPTNSQGVVIIDANSKNPTALTSNAVRDGSFWSPVPVTMAREHRFRLFQTSWDRTELVKKVLFSNTLVETPGGYIKAGGFVL